MSQNLAYRLMNGVGASALCRRLKPPRGVIFMCHSVGEASRESFDPLRIWRISSEQLEATIRLIGESGFQAIGMDAAADRISSEGTAQPFYSITFDDGYTDNLEIALPICTRYRVPMMTYVTSGFVKRDHIAWWHMIDHLILHREKLEINLGDDRLRFACATTLEKQNTFDTLSKTLTHASADDRERILFDISNRYGDDAMMHARDLFLTEPQLRELSESQFGEIGVHGVSHVAFSSMDTIELKRELDYSRSYLEAVTGSPPRHLAYPFGTPGTVSERDLDLVADSGYVSAVTTRHGCLTNGSTRLFDLPRIPLFPHDTESSLKCKLSGLTTLLAKWRAA